MEAWNGEKVEKIW